jgi:hypothetical protein
MLTRIGSEFAVTLLGWSLHQIQYYDPLKTEQGAEIRALGTDSASGVVQRLARTISTIIHGDRHRRPRAGPAASVAEGPGSSRGTDSDPALSNLKTV